MKGERNEKEKSAQKSYLEKSVGRSVLAGKFRRRCLQCLSVSDPNLV